MTKKNDGGSAFPHPSLKIRKDGFSEYVGAQQGMTLRQYYAGQALAGLRGINVMIDAKLVATLCFADADALIAAEQEPAHE